MTSASLDDARELPSLSPARVAGPLCASVVLHGALLFLVARGVMVPDAASREELPSVSVSLVTRLPVPIPETPLQEIPEPEVPAPEAMAPTETGQVETLAPEAANNEALPAEEVTGEPDASATNTDVGGESQPWTPARIRAAIDANASGQRSASTASWLSSCYLEQRLRGTRDCELQREEQDYASASMRAGQNAGAGSFASVTRPLRDWRMFEEFTRRNYALQELADAGGVVGMLATDRIRINNEYMRYLQGNVLGFQGQDPLWQAMGSGFSADVLSGPRLTLPGNVPFRCGTGKLLPEPGLVPGGVGVSNIVPCVFEFTGFRIQRPDQPVEENAFRVVPTVPGNQQYDTPARPVTRPFLNPVTP
jgi:hypothetical protein